MGLRLFYKPVGLLVLGFLLSSVLPVSGAAVPVVTNSYYLQSPNNHTANDIPANVNFRTTRKVIQLTLTSVAELAGQPD